MFEDVGVLKAWPALVGIGLLVAGCLAAEAAPWTIGKPIVTYWAGPDMTEATAAQMAEGGYNVVWCNKTQLDTVHKHGLRAMVHDGLINPASLDDPARKAELDQLIAAVKDHPAMYAYFIGDEPNAARFPGLGKLFAYLREKDPAHLAYLNLFPTYASNEQLGNSGDVVTAYTEHLRQYVDLVKPGLISYDHYHYTIGGDSKQYFLNLGLIRQAALQAGVPFLNIVQACTWAPDSMRIPHTAEVRWLVNTSLAYGAQGISYYVYCHPGHYGALATADGQPTPLYYGLQPANRDFVAIAEQLQPLVSLGAYHVNDNSLGAEALPPAAPVRVAAPGSKAPALIGYFGPAGGTPTHVAVVNLDYTAPVVLRVTAPRELSQFVPARGHWRPLHSRAPLVRLPAAGIALLRLR